MMWLDRDRRFDHRRAYRSWFKRTFEAPFICPVNHYISDGWKTEAVRYFQLEIVWKVEAVTVESCL